MYEWQKGPTLVSPFWYMERGPPHLPNDGMTMKPSPMATNQIAADAQSFIMQKQHSDGVESSKPKKKKRKMPSENGDTLAPVGTGGKGCSRRPARIRTSFTNEQIQELEAHFLRCMYPRSTEIQRISSQLQLTENIVQVWFQNRRAKWRKPRNLTGIPGRPSASRMNNTQLYERNPEFIEMQTKAIMLQNRDGTPEEIPGQGAGGAGNKMNTELNDSCMKEKGRKGATMTSVSMAKTGMSSGVVSVGASGHVPLLLASGGAASMVSQSNAAQGAMDSVVATQNGPQLILPMYPTGPGAVVFQAGGVSHQTQPSMLIQASPYQLPSQMVFSQPHTSSSVATEFANDSTLSGRFSTSHRDSNTSLQSQGSGSRHGSLDNIPGSRTPSCNGSNEGLARGQPGASCLRSSVDGSLCPTSRGQPQLPEYGSVDQLYSTSLGSSMFRNYSTTNIPDPSAHLRSRPHFQSIENISGSCGPAGGVLQPGLSFDLAANRSQSQGSIHSQTGTPMESATPIGQAPRLPSYLSQPSGLDESVPASDPWSLAPGAPHFTSCTNIGEVSSRSTGGAFPPHMHGLPTSSTSAKPQSMSQIPDVIAMQSRNLQKANSYNGFPHFFRHHDGDGSLSLLGSNSMQQDSTGSLLEHQSSTSTSLRSLKDHISSTSSIHITTTEGYEGQFNILSDSHAQFQNTPMHGSGDFLHSPVDQTYSPIDPAYPLAAGSDLMGPSSAIVRGAMDSALQQRRYSGTPLQQGAQPLASTVRRHSVTVPVANRHFSSGPPNVEVKPPGAPTVKFR